MLHYKIMSYDRDSEWEIMVKLKYLGEEHDIESVFMKRLNMPCYDDSGEPTDFTSELSLKLMKDVAQAERIGEYAVDTPNGKACITCLSTDAKFGLIVIDEAGSDRPVITRVETVGWKVLEWLSKNGDFTLVLAENECDKSLMEVVTMVSSGLADIEYCGDSYSAYNIGDCMTALDKFLYRENKE